MFLLDTVALSEPTKPRPNAGFVDWLSGVDLDALHTSVLCLGEIRRGVLRLPPSPKRDRLAAWLRDELPAWLGPRMLDVDREAAFAWADLGERATANAIDALIGATAKAHGLAVVTRNVRDFDGLGVAVVNPWT